MSNTKALRPGDMVRLTNKQDHRVTQVDYIKDIVTTISIISLEYGGDRYLYEWDIEVLEKGHDTLTIGEVAKKLDSYANAHYPLFVYDPDSDQPMREIEAISTYELEAPHTLENMLTISLKSQL